jgi:protoporphyrinogen oxidase
LEKLELKVKMMEVEKGYLNEKTNDPDYLVIGAGFAGLTLGLRLAQAGKKVIILESDKQVGGLASDFKLKNGLPLERFYHHWFRHDTSITALIDELGLGSMVKEYPSNTGMYFNKTVWNLSSPLDLLRFKAIGLVDRVRLGIAILLVRRVKDWKKIEHKSIREWLEPLCGTRAYRIVWEPLVTAKFSIFSEEVSAAWMWKKLVLRGSTRSKNGVESLLYIDGGFGKLAEAIADRIVSLGGQVICDNKLLEINVDGDTISQITTLNGGDYHPENLIFTGAPSQLPQLIRNNPYTEWSRKLEAIDYLANICLILLLDRSLSETYWLNVNDPGFPFVGVIEHTNLVSETNYGDLHVVYLSRYIATEHEDYRLPDDKYLSRCIDSLKKMFPEFNDAWIKEHYIWRTPYAQPITTKNYSTLMPSMVTPYKNLFLNSMAQIYPEDRGTNYAVRNAEILAQELLSKPNE